jgi:hypothetical protein
MGEASRGLLDQLPGLPGRGGARPSWCKQRGIGELKEAETVNRPFNTFGSGL